MPTTMNAIRIENATLISTTSGIPCAPVAARFTPFSSDRNPATWLTALRRVTIINRPISTTDSDSAMSSRATGSACAVTGSMTISDSATSAMPASMVSPMLTTVSISRWMPRLNTIRRSAIGMTIALNPSAMRRGDVEMRRVLDLRLPGHRQRQDQRMQRQHVDQRIQPVLVQHHEAGQHQPAGQHVGDIEGETVRHMPPDTNSSSTPSRPSISAAPRKFGTRNTRILAIDISNTPSSVPATASLNR